MCAVSVNEDSADGIFVFFQLQRKGKILDQVPEIRAQKCLQGREVTWKAHCQGSSKIQKDRGLRPEPGARKKEQRPKAKGKDRSKKPDARDQRPETRGLKPET